MRALGMSHCSERAGREGVRSGAPCDGRRAMMPYKSAAVSTEVSESMCSETACVHTCHKRGAVPRGRGGHNFGDMGTANGGARGMARCQG